MFFRVQKSKIFPCLVILALFVGMLEVNKVYAGNGLLAPALLSAGETMRVSLSSSGEEANGDSVIPVISADGRYIAFSSEATNLVSDDTNGLTDIFVRDLQTGQTTRVSVDSNGVEANGNSGYYPSISGDGRYIAFYSYATNLVPDDTNGTWDIFVHDMQTGSTQRVSINSTGVQGNDQSTYASISADGRYITFGSYASNLVPNDTNGVVDIFVYDVQNSTVKRASVDSSGLQANAGSQISSISADGRYVGFYSYATNLVSGDTNGMADIFVHDMQTGLTTRVSVDSNGVQANAESHNLSVSADGRYIVFESHATNLIPDDTNGMWDVFVHDMQTGATTRVSVDSNGMQGDGNSYYPSVSADGRLIGFYSGSTNLIPDDTNGAMDVFVRDMQTGITTRASVGSNGAQANSSSLEMSLSANGEYVTFYSYANNLVAGDANYKTDIFVHRQNTLLTPTASPTQTTAPTNTQVFTATPTTTAIPSLFQPYINYPGGSGQNAHAVGIGDFNSDGLKDVAMTVTDRLLIFLQKSDGALASPVTYSTLATGSSPLSLAVGDLNNDHRADVVTTDGNTIAVYLQQPDGTFTVRVHYPTDSTPDAVAVGDVNSDGLADVAVSHWNAGDIGIFLQNANGSLDPMIRYASPKAGYDDIAIGDVDNDGRNDVVKMNGQLYTNPNLSVYLQDANGSLAQAVPYSLGCNCLGHGIGIGDVTGDDRADIAMSYGGNRPDSRVAIFAQDSSGSMLPPVSYAAYDIPEPVEVADVNMDGLADVLTAHGGWGRMSVFLQQAGSGLGTYSLYPISSASHYQPQGLAVGDINNDGLPDVAIADSNSGLIVLYHTLASDLPTPTPTLTNTPMDTPTVTATDTLTPTSTQIPSSTPTPTYTVTLTPTATVTLTPTVTTTPTKTPKGKSPTKTPVPTRTPRR